MNLEFDHLGIIVKSLETEIPIYQKMGYIEDSKIFQDDNQQMRGIFLKPLENTVRGGDLRIELVEDLSESKSFRKMLGSYCGRVYHIAYKVNNLEKNIENIINSLDARVLSPVKPAAYYKNVCFLFLNNLQIIELVEYR